MQIFEETFYNILPNGVKIVHRTTHSPVAYVGIMVGAGTRDELDEENGMAHYIEHCVFKGTQTRSARKIISQIEGIGGEVNAYTTKEETTFYAATPVEHLSRTMMLIADMVMHPIFDKKETDKELGVILDEIESYNDSPSELIYDDFESLVFSGNPLALPILGTKKTLKRISKSAENPLRWMQLHYRPERMVVFVQANAKPQNVLRMVEATGLGTLTSTPDTACIRLKPGDMGNERTATYKKHTHQAHVMMGGRAYELGHERQLTMYLMNNILGGGSLNSRLNLSLREKRGLVYTVESNYTPLSDTGYWSVYFASEPQHKDQCIELVQKELRHLQDTTMSSLSLHRAIRQLRGQMAISAENQENNSLSMGKQMLYYGQAPTWMETFQKIERITPRMIQDTALELLHPDSICMLSYE